MPSRIAILLGVCAVLGCTFINPTDFHCEDDTSCPSGYICGGKGFCVAGSAPDGGSSGLDAGMDAGTGQDAGPQIIAPSDLKYLVNPAAYSVGQPIIPNTPSSSGGTVVSYSVSPALPAGLTLAAATGIITGTPTMVSAMADYTVTAENSAGSTTATLAISVAVATCDPTSNMACPNGQICNLSGTCVLPKYTVANGEVTDGDTMLVWQQAVAANPCPSDGMGVCTMSDAMAYCQALNLNGTGWMLPSLTQLYSLVLMGASPAIDMTDFPSVTGVPFWTSTADGSGYAWTVDFSDGYAVGSVAVSLDAAVICVK